MKPYLLSLSLWLIVTCSQSVAPAFSNEATLDLFPSHHQNSESTDLGELRRREAKERQQWEENRRNLESSNNSKPSDDRSLNNEDDVTSSKSHSPIDHHPLLQQQGSPNYSYFDDARHNFGIGGLDDVWNQIKRRIWIPLLTPPEILQQLGLQSTATGNRSVMGLLLYGPPGCGKTLIAKNLARLFSPLR